MQRHGQLRTEQFLGLVLSLGNNVTYKFLHELPLCGCLRVQWDNQTCETGNRVCVFRRGGRVYDRSSDVARQLVAKRVNRCGGAQRSVLRTVRRCSEPALPAAYFGWRKSVPRIQFPQEFVSPRRPRPHYLFHLVHLASLEISSPPPFCPTTNIFSTYLAKIRPTFPCRRKDERLRYSGSGN